MEKPDCDTLKMGCQSMNEKLFHQIAVEIQNEYQMGGLAGTMYEDYAKDICKRYLERTKVPEAPDYSPKQFRLDMGKIASDNMNYTEERHIDMDKCASAALKKLGYGDGAEIWDKTDKWYA